MKKTALALLLIGAAGLLQAQEGTKWFNVQGAYIHQDGDWSGREFYEMIKPDFDIDNSFGYGVGLGTWLTNRWGLEGSILTTKLEADGFTLPRQYNFLEIPDQSGRETHFFASGLMNLNPGGEKFYPYLRAGIGATHLEEPWSAKDSSTTKFQYHGGLGIQGFFAEHVIASAEARYVHINSHDSRNELMGILGLGYRWGNEPVAAPEPEPEPAPAPVVEPVAPPPPPPPPPPVEVKPVVVPPPPPPPPAKIVLDQAVLHFKNDKAVLSPEGVAAIQKVAEEIKAYPGEYTLVVNGHTSLVGGRAHNMALSKRRANAVAKVLVDSGIPAASVTTAGYGPDQPVADNKTREGAAKNRRVEIEVKVSNAAVETNTIMTEIQD